MEHEQQQDTRRSYKYSVVTSQNTKGIISIDVKINFDDLPLPKELDEKDRMTTKMNESDTIKYYADLMLDLRQQVEKRYKDFGYRLAGDINE